MGAQCTQGVHTLPMSCVSGNRNIGKDKEATHGLPELLCTCTKDAACCVPVAVFWSVQQNLCAHAAHQ